MANPCNQIPNGACSVAEGFNTIANGVASHAEGFKTIANGGASHAEGSTTTTGGSASHSEGYKTVTTADTAHAEGSTTTAGGAASHAEGFMTVTTADTAHAEGNSTTANGVASHAEGKSTTASGMASHAEGQSTMASGTASHTEGQFTTASGRASHAEGLQTNASGPSAHAEGSNSIASGPSAHAEGTNTIASGAFSHAEGANTIADGQYAHAEGFQTQALALESHAEGESTIVNATDIGSHIMGQNGSTRFPFSWHLANGLVAGPTLNSVVIEGATGNLYLDGTVLSPNAADYAEMFETTDGQAIDVGYFVTFDSASDKIRKANATDQYILGIVSARPAILADSCDLRWHNLFLTDEWGRVQYHDVVVPETTDTEGNVIRSAFAKTEPILNPEWDNSKNYIPRLQRPEWVAVGVVGKLLVRDDGTCEAGGYCKPDDEGNATAASTGYRVMKRTGPNIVQIFVK